MKSQKSFQRTSPFFPAVTIVVGSAMLATNSIHAADGTWNQTGGGDWETNANWNPVGDGFPNGVGQVATLGNSITADASVEIDNNRTVGTLNIDSGFNYTVSEAAVKTLTFDSTTDDDAQINVTTVNGTGAHVLGFTRLLVNDDLAIFIDTGGSLRINARLRGSKTISKTGTGILTLAPTTADSFTGSIAVNAGTLNILSTANNNTVLGNTTGGTTVASGAVLQLDGTPGDIAIGNEALTLNGAGLTASPAGALRNIAGANSWAGAVTLGSASTIQSDAGSITFSGGIDNGGNLLTVQGAGDAAVSTVAISGAGGLTKDGTGSLTLTSTNTYTGDTTISGGTLQLGDGTTGNDGSLASSLITNNGALVYNLFGTSTYNGKISGSGDLIKTGTGTQILSGTSSDYTGNTVIKQGTLHVGNSGNGDLGISPDSHIFLGDTSGSSDATLRLGQSNSTTYANDITVQSGNTGVVAIRAHGNHTLNGTLTLGSAGSDGKSVTIEEIGNASWVTNFNEAIQDASGMTPGTGGTVTIGSDNTGRVRFFAANTYTGDTLTANSANNSRLSLHNNDALQNSTLDTGVSGAQSVEFVVGGTYNIGGLKGGDELAFASRTISVGANDSSNTFSGVLSGTSGALTKVGTGTQILTGANTYDGTTTISGGSLVLGDGTTGNDGTLASTSIVNDANLTYSRFAGSGLDYTGVISGSGTLTKTGAGTQILSGNNSYTGITTISSGTLQVGDGGSTGSLGSGAIVNNAELVYDLDAGGSATLPSGGITGSGNLSATAGKIALYGDVTQGGSINLTEHASATATYSGISVFTDSTLTANSITLNGDIGKELSPNGNSLVLDTSATNGTINLEISLGKSGQYFQLNSFMADAGTGTINITGSDTWRQTPVTLKGSVNMTGNVNSERSVTIDTNGTDTGIISGVFSNSMPLTKTGAGSLTLTGANSYSSSTTISGGTLSAENDKALGNTSLLAVTGGTLEVRGSIADTLTLGGNADLQLISGTIAFDLGTAFDQIVSSGTGSFDITGGTFALDVTGAGFDYGDAFEVLSGFGGSNTVTGLSFTGYDTVNYTASLDNTGFLSFTAVPEPSAFALLGLGVIGLCVRRRR
ncbi:MAG: autotransporter-associated beta strand repeat-containing protein [Luteolibacter sp.]